MFDKRYKSHHDAEACYRSLLERDRSSFQEMQEYLQHNTLVQKENAIYIHVPFCDRICSFCNMNRTIIDDTIESYVSQLETQIKNMGSYNAFANTSIQAIYFGGGTPTVLAPGYFKRILHALRTAFHLDSDCEITSETTIHNLTDEHLNVFGEIGINRISIGIQTFQSAGRVFFNRMYTKEEAIARLKEIRSKFKGLICIDKIYNYPSESVDMLLDDVKLIQDLEIDSVSFYSLMIHEGSHLSKTYGENQLSAEQDAIFHDIFVSELLDSGEYEWLELTKIGRKGRDSYRYMSIRNNNGNTIPLGKGAGGKIDHFHVYNMDFDRIMIARSTQAYEETAHSIYGEFQNPRISKAKMKRLPYINFDLFNKKIKHYMDQGLIYDQEATWELSLEGIFYGNNIGGELTKSFLESLKG